MEFNSCQTVAPWPAAASCSRAHLTRTFFAVQGKWGRLRRQGRKWISVPISSRAPVSGPRRLSNTMFYKLMFLEVGQGYPQPWRRRRTSSVSQKVFWTRHCTTGGYFNPTCLYVTWLKKMVFCHQFAVSLASLVPPFFYLSFSLFTK